MFIHPALQQFRQLCQNSEPPLFEASLLLAEALGCTFARDAVSAEMNRLEAGLRERLGQTMEPMLQIRILGQYLAGEEGFQGNEERYYESDNSLIPRVLETRKGIPISLSILTIELAQRLGLPVRGIGLPGHFICGYEHSGRTCYFDPFHRWRLLSRNEAELLILRMFGESVEISDEFFRPWDSRLILDRSIRNLKSVYLSRGDLESALKAVEFILAVMPEQLCEIRDRGILRSRLGKYGLAYGDLARYLEASPDAPDASQVQRELCRVRKQIETLN